MKDMLNILIAESNKIILDIIKNNIQKDSRYNIIGIAEDENTEIELINKLKPDIVITNLKKKDGWTGIEIIKYFHNKAFCPIFFIISGSINNYVKELVDLNIQYYLQKPFISSEFLSILDRIYNDLK